MTVDSLLPGGLAGTAVLFLCFICSASAACLFVAASGEDSSSALSGYLHGYMELVGEGAVDAASLWTVVWDLCRWPVLVFLLGLTALGAVAIPAVFCVRGFLLAYSIASFARVFGPAGLLASIAVFGMTALASMPVLFCVGSMSLTNSVRLAVGVLEDRPSGLLQRERLLALIPCGGLTALAAALEQTVLPQLLTGAARILSEG